MLIECTGIIKSNKDGIINEKCQVIRICIFITNIRNREIKLINIIIRIRIKKHI